ncbi:protein of unknown function [Candidatus Nitrosotalea okcheonensis]|uniref:Uncharacterized protein n=1 Tax=Candidatus Nitrosotalea okcheonensis TaxID=1903276 RepID=A0A2H1FGX3_9ARCH|nr:protein of unknown function [Candidatus Nitrosotalea okcheonensis]
MRYKITWYETITGIPETVEIDVPEVKIGTVIIPFDIIKN